MPTFSCNKKIACPGNDNPLGNFSSEDPDSAFRIGYSTGTAPTSSFRKRGGTGPISNSDDPSGDPEVGEETADTGTGGNPPPIGSEFDNLTVTTFTEIIDDDDPDTDPGNVNIDQLVDTDDPGAGGWKLRPTRTTPTIFVNQPQTCIVNCPDGSPFEFTVPVGRFRALSQDAANRAAYSYACKQAQRNLLCIGAASTTGGCVGVAFNAVIPAYGLNRPIIFEVVSGVIPSWMTLFQTSAAVFLTGTPSSSDVGSDTFIIQATDSRGFTMTREFTVTVMDFSTATDLPAFTKGVPYSKTIIAVGGVTPYIFTIVSGDLPSGLFLDESGEISGVPTVDYALFPVLVQVRDAEGHICRETYSFGGTGCTISDSPTLPPFYQGEPYSHQLTATNGAAPYTFAIISGVLPDGLSLSTSGLISGTVDLVNGNLTESFLVQATGADSATCAKALTLPIWDYNTLPTGKGWRIASYADNLFPVAGGPFGCSCGASGNPVVPWNGEFNDGSGGNFLSDQRNVPGEVSINGATRSVIVRLDKGEPQWVGFEGWRITITCVSGSEWIWCGVKVGSNLGDQLDSPAGTYQLTTGQLGEPAICATTATVVIEEFTL